VTDSLYAEASCLPREFPRNKPCSVRKIVIILRIFQYQVLSLNAASRVFNHPTTRMWANTHRDGRPVEYRWRDAKPVEICMGAQTAEPISAVSGPNRRSSPYYQDMWRYCCLTSFFPIVDTCLSCEDTARQSCSMVRRWRFLVILHPVFPASRVQHLSDLHSKFALRPYGRHPIFDL